MKTDTTELKKAYKKANQALKDAGKAANEELAAQEKELRRDTSAALQNAYVENIRAAQRSGQVNRAAGITGGQAIAADIGRENRYGAARTDLMMNRETGLGQIKNQRKLNDANTAADVASNKIALQGQLFDIKQNDENYVRQTYAAMLQNGYIPKDSAELTKMASYLGLPEGTIRTYVNYINNQK